MSLPEDKRLIERAKLDQMFGDSPFLDQRISAIDPSAKTQDWYTEFLLENTELKFRDYEIVSGRTALTLRMYESFAYLIWDCNLPEPLRLGKNVGDHDAFLDFILEEFPKKIYGLEEVKNVKELYEENSKVKLTYKKSKETKDYSFSSERDNASLIAELVVHPETIKDMEILGIASEPLQGRGFWLTINYGDDRDLAILQLGLPLKPEAARGWNSDVLNWVLESHLNREELSDIDVATANLKEEIIKLLKPSFLEQLSPNR